MCVCVRERERVRIIFFVGTYLCDTSRISGSSRTGLDNDEVPHRVFSFAPLSRLNTDRAFSVVLALIDHVDP